MQHSKIIRAIVQRLNARADRADRQATRIMDMLIQLSADDADRPKLQASYDVANARALEARASAYAAETVARDAGFKL